jgi:hypothetical protein
MKTIPSILVVVGFGVLLWAWFGYRREGVSAISVGLFWKALTPAGTRLYAAGMVLALLGMLLLFLGT